MIYPNNSRKNNFDGLVTILLLITCMLTPYRIAFPDDSTTWTIINSFIDFIYLVDILLSFISAFYTEEYELVEDRTRIAVNYLMSWFLIDFFAIFPFEWIANYGE